MSESLAQLYTLDGYKVQTASLLEKLMTHHGNGLHSSCSTKEPDNKNKQNGPLLLNLIQAQQAERLKSRKRRPDG